MRLRFGPALGIVIVATLTSQFARGQSAGLANSSTVNLLPLIDVKRDAVSGTWKKDGNELVGVPPSETTTGRLAIPFRAPAEYDFTIEFTRLSGHDAIVQMFRWGNSEMLWTMGSGGKKLAFVAGNRGLPHSEDESVTKTGVKFVSTVKVRRDRIEAFLDGKLISVVDQPITNAKLKDVWSLPRDSSLGIGTWGTPIRISKLELVPVTESGDDQRDVPAPRADLHSDAPAAAAPLSAPTTRTSKRQASVQSLEILEAPSGMMLGQTSEAVLTINPGTQSKSVTIQFITPVGNDMTTARDEMLRYIHLTYPNWYADSAELTFEDKYVKHDGGSIGAALGTLILSVIQGFDIDPDAAITGDISANGKVRAIGGVSAKMRGAVASKCKLAAVPNENYDQLIDTLVYSGQAAVSDVQIMGISTLSDAVAVLRTDRDPKLAKAIEKFGAIQQKLHDEAASPIKKPSGYIHSAEIVEKFNEVLELAPNHLSAKLLLALAQNKEPKTLSPTASEYYTFVAVRSMAAVFSDRAKSIDRNQVTPAVVRQGLADLNKLRVISDPTVRPLIDAWTRFISTWNSIESGGSGRTFDRERQAVLDEMAKLQADQDLMQKMLKEGM